MLLSASDLQSIVADKNTYLTKLSNFETHCAKIEKEQQTLKDELASLLSKKQPDMKEITDRMINEALDSQASKFDMERMQMTNFL